MFHYRIATMDDCETLACLRLQMRSERDPTFTEEALLESTLSYFRRNLENGSHIAFLCEEEGAVIATAGLVRFELPPTMKKPNGQVAKLMNMYVIPARRRRGVATALLEHIFAYLRAQGCARVMLNASPTGELLYRSLGFRQIPNEFEYIL